MTVSLRNAGLRTEPYKAPTVPGVIRTTEDALDNTHPYPILYRPEFFVCLCVACDLKEIAERRATLAAAVYDRLTHSRTHGGN